MKKWIPFWIGACVFFLQMLSCSSLEEDYSANPAHHLSFSVDTLSFDTVFTSIGTATRQFMVYNKHPRALNIERIRLAKTGVSGFRINVDGRKGNDFRNIEILSGDSLYIFVEATIDPTNKDQALLVQDSLLFELNGNHQRVLLEAIGQDVHLFKGGRRIESDETFAADKPYLIYDSLTIAEDATLTMLPGVECYLHDNAVVSVSGKLIAEGTLDKPILFRGDRTDDVLEGVLSYDRTPGQWGGLSFDSSSYGNVLNHVVIRNAKRGLYLSSSNTEQEKLFIANAQVTNMTGEALLALNCRVKAVNTEFSNTALSTVQLQGGHYEFVHCTLANYMSLETRRSPSLSMSSLSHQENAFPLEARFDNCIIDGSFGAGNTDYSGELYIEESTAESPINYHFNHCVIKTKGAENDRFVAIQFAKSPTYKLLGGEKNKYCYDFRLDTITSPGVEGADLEIAKQYPQDRLGVERVGGVQPSVGAYQFVPKE